MKSRNKWIAFNPDKRWLRLLPDHILKLIIDRALEGEITKAGEELVLMPDRREGRPDACGVYKIGRIRMSDCTTLKQLVRQIRKTETVTDKSNNTISTPNKINVLESEKTRKMSTPCTGTKTTKKPIIRNGCKACGRHISGRRKDAKFCSSRCRQNHHRNPE